MPSSETAPDFNGIEPLLQAEYFRVEGLDRVARGIKKILLTSQDFVVS